MTIAVSSYRPSSIDIDHVRQLGDVSRETISRFATYLSELKRWQKVKNLVSDHTLEDAWNRHIVDSAQLFFLAPDAKRWLDLGSGGGAPGIILGIMLSDVGGHIHLVEANARKSAFLRHAARETGAAVTVHNSRIEASVSSFDGKVDMVTARALAPLPLLLEWTSDLFKSGAKALFPKGQDVVAELTESARSWSMDYELLQSRTSEAARIVYVKSLASVDDRRCS